MSQRPRIQVTQTQRLQLNIGLQVSIKLLRADAAGLTRYLEEQAADNPHLALDPPPLPAAGEWLPRWTRVFAAEPMEGRDQAGPGQSLMAHVLGTIDRRMKSVREREIALALAEALEPSGWLGRPVAEIASTLGARMVEVEAVLRRLQEIEPVGLFARDLAECLRLQAQEEGSLDRTMAVMLTNLDLLAAGRLARLADLAGVDESEITRRFQLIRAMNPKPGTEFDDLAVERPREPDLIARQDSDGRWQVALNRSSLPALRIVAEGAGSAADLAAAKGLQRMVTARNSTLLAVGAEIMRRQQRALDDGPGYLAPITMAEVAEAVGLHESTVSRVVAGSSVDTPRGTWWLRLLFSRGLGNDQLSGSALRDRLARLVGSEPPGAPLSDAVLAVALSVDGTRIARRTVAKYRAMLGIAPAHRRRR
ncbi:MAG: RNA polymerase factor sigma-54 [bacterium]